MADIHVRGLRELRQKLLQLPNDVARKHLQKAVNKGADNTLRAARARAHVESGDMKRGIRRRAANKRLGKWARGAAVGVLTDEKEGGLANASANTQKVRVGTTNDGKPKYRYMYSRAQRRALGNKTGLTGFANSDLYYWRFEEFGSSKHPAHPFLRPGFESTKGAQIATLKKVLSASVFTEAEK